MKNLLAPVLFAAVVAAAPASANETTVAAHDPSTGVMPEFVVSVPRPLGTESVGVMPEMTVTARALPRAEVRAARPAPTEPPAAAPRVAEARPVSAHGATPAPSSRRL